MTLKILSIKTRKANALNKDEKCIYVEISFTIPKESYYIFDRLRDHYKTMVTKDWKAYEKEISKSKMKFVSLGKKRGSIIKWTGSEKHKLVQMDAIGIGMLRQNKDKSFLFSEYFTVSPVVTTTISEIKKIKRNPNHSYHTTVEYYFSKLLETLSMYWD